MKNWPLIIWLCWLCLGTSLLSAQPFSRADSLHGSLSPLRSCYDVTFYDLEVKFSPEKKRIAGRNIFYFEATRDFQRLQFDLFTELQIAKVLYHGQPLVAKREYHAVFLDFPEPITAGSRDSFTVYYGGRPQEATRPPWDGGMVWKKDQYGFPWVGVACEDLGASSWWPLKDHLSDEPDSMRISLIAKDDLVAIANGELRSRRKLAGNFDRWEWFVNYPINSYGVSFYLGDYEHFSDRYENGDSRFSLDYYVLAGNEAVAQKHFQQVTPMLKIFEKYFGPYPFPKDGYALVESSYWGMEHQSAIAYGNKFNNEALWGFDFIIIHESAHEWFGNSLSVGDLAELWINEAFATYAEMVYLEERFDREKAEQYLLSQRRRILNQRPMLGPLGVNYRNADDSDIYFKGSWMLHSLRNTVNNDSLWFATLYDYATEHRLSILNTEQVISFFNQKLGSDYRYHFNQYLKHAELPVLEWKIRGKKKNTELMYRWQAAEKDFRMPIHLKVKGKELRLTPGNEWQSLPKSRLKAHDIELNTVDFLFEVKAVE